MAAKTRIIAADALLALQATYAATAATVSKQGGQVMDKMQKRLIDQTKASNE